jgi:DNA helicase II / ATP-dependent DNA helicase PcrA
MLDLLLDLNEAQKEVVLTTEGPILVLAGAGSGKTKALTHRIAYLIMEKKVDRSRILAITFTNKAAKEMTTRVKKLTGFAPATMGTFHSICARILRKEAHHLGYSASFVIYDDGDSKAVIKNAFKKLDIDSTKISPQSVKAQISNAKNELLGPDSFEERGGYKDAYIAEVFQEYQKALKKNDAMDFDDLLVNVVKIFEQFPDVLAKYQSIWEYILIDEYQDTNKVQYLFAKYLAEKNHNLCVVGDDWQSIYSWRGANYRNILNFKRDWPDAKVVRLEQNYRSTKAILSAAQAVIERNQDRSEKVLWTENEAGTAINVYEAANEAEESSFVAREILRLSAQKRLSDIAVFYRTNAQSRVLEEQLLRYQIPYKIVGGVRFYERKEVKDVLAWLRMASGANDWIAFERSLSAPPSGVGKVSLTKLKNLAELHNNRILELLASEDLTSTVPAKAAKSLVLYNQKVQSIATASDQSIEKGIEKAITASGIKDYLSDGNLQNEERLENLKELISVAAEYEKIKGKMNLCDFLEEVALIADVDNYQEEAEGITLMTLHTSKGLEYNNVFIIGLEENIFPHSRSLFSPTELEEERRLFYVGLTRACKTAYLIYARSRLFFGNIQSNPPSRFLTEIPENLVNYLNKNETPELKEVEEERMVGAIKKGDIVEHESFGVGEVVRVNEDELTVIFNDSGEKIVSLYYAPIKKL